MTAIAYAQNITAKVVTPDARSLHCGGGTDLFSSGSISTASDMRAGDQTGLFTTSCVPSCTQMATGDLVEIFTTSC